jgi:hypothetical protein
MHLHTHLITQTILLLEKDPVSTGRDGSLHPTLVATKKNSRSIDARPAECRSESDRVSRLARARYMYLYPAWKHAIRLLAVLVQRSSATAERIFTQLKKIVDAYVW